MECLAILLNLSAVIGYVTSFDFFYTHYEALLTLINLAELGILVLGAPWNELSIKLSGYLRYNTNRNPANYFNRENNQEAP